MIAIVSHPHQTTVQVIYNPLQIFVFREQLKVRGGLELPLNVKLSLGKGMVA